MPAFTHFLRSPVPEIIISPVRSQGCRSRGICSRILAILRDEPGASPSFPSLVARSWPAAFRSAKGGE